MLNLMVPTLFYCILLYFQGFCLPEEIAAGGDGEGSMNFHDYEGGGIGEGEGTNDVSDKIENEDQVMQSLNLTNILYVVIH